MSRAERCEVGDIEGDATWIEYVVAVCAGGCGVTGVEDAAETGAAGVIYEGVASAEANGVGAAGIEASAV